MRFLATGVLLVQIASTAFAQVELDFSTRERIESYSSRIQILEDGYMDVVETIRVNALGQEIKRGIYRDFPTVYQTEYYTKVVVPFRVNRVLRDGKPEPFRIEPQSDGARLYIGSPNHFLEPGPYTYMIEYRTGRQVGFFDAFDELYWNVTGNQWSFPIERATATVVLPQSVPLDQVNLEAYTGAYGSTGHDYSSSVEPNLREIRFASTRTLGSFEGLTIVVRFPKGFVRPPTRQEKWQEFLISNRMVLYGAIGLVFVFLYYVTAWILVGRDPERGILVPRFEPPLNLSPAGTRYLYRMGYDSKCFAAALISLAVKGSLRILEGEDGVYTLIRTNQAPRNLSQGERSVFNTLLKRDSLSLTNSNHSSIGKAVKHLRAYLRAESEGKHFLANRHWLVPGCMLSVAAVLLSAVAGAAELLPAGFMLVWLSLWTLGVLILSTQVVRSWRRAMARGRSATDIFGALFMTAFALPFFGGEVLGFWVLVQMVSIWMVPLVLLLVGTNYLFFHWIKRPTGPGRKLLDQIDGFRTFLSAAEQDRLNFLTPPDRTPELFEKYLPYALALGVENEWAQQFTEVLAAAAVAPGQTGYRPGWYSGNSFDANRLTGFTGGLGSSLGGAVSSSSRPPGSSSGGGGGGFSGGGGGGGGGGGW